MQIDIVTLFPEMFQGPLSESLLKKAQDKGLLRFTLTNIRDFTMDKHKTADGTPYGGGPGMVMMVDVVASAIDSLKQKVDSRTSNVENRVILMSPTGKPLTQAKVNQLAQYRRLIIVCGHYEGIDERINSYIDEEISIGDYVLTGGELPSMVLIDALARQIPGVVKEEASVKTDSFYYGLLDHPSYTRPEEFDGRKVPAPLLSGHHAEIDKWRRRESLKKTLWQRPDLLATADLTKDDKITLGEIFSFG